MTCALWHVMHVRPGAGSSATTARGKQGSSMSWWSGRDASSGPATRAGWGRLGGWVGGLAAPSHCARLPAAAAASSLLRPQPPQLRVLPHPGSASSLGAGGGQGRAGWVHTACCSMLQQHVCSMFVKCTSSQAPARCSQPPASPHNTVCNEGRWREGCNVPCKHTKKLEHSLPVHVAPVLPAGRL